MHDVFSTEAGTNFQITRIPTRVQVGLRQTPGIPLEQYLGIRTPGQIDVHCEERCPVALVEGSFAAWAKKQNLSNTALIERGLLIPLPANLMDPVQEENYEKYRTALNLEWARQLTRLQRKRAEKQRDARKTEDVLLA